VTKKWTRLSLVIGVVLLLPSACAIATDSLNGDDDAAVAFTPVVRLSMESLRAGAPVELIFRVPDSAQWKRIREDRRMGDNGYIVLAANRRNEKLVAFSTLNLELAVSGRRGPISLHPADGSPYGYSSDTRDVGVQFRPLPGDDIYVRLTARRPELLPPGELIIEPYWSGAAKDYLVGASLDSDMRPVVIRITQLAFVLLAVGITFYVVELLRGSKSASF